MGGVRKRLSLISRRPSSIPVTLDIRLPPAIQNPRNPRSAERGTWPKKESKSCILGPSEEQRQLLVFVAVQKVRFLVLTATSSGPAPIALFA
jgi:hypothetical protein